MRRTIPGALDYAALARQNRPHTVDEMRCAIHELHARGFDDYQVAAATDLSVEAVRRMLGERKEAR